jgi:hypothetical protein
MIKFAEPMSTENLSVFWWSSSSMVGLEVGVEVGLRVTMMETTEFTDSTEVIALFTFVSKDGSFNEASKETLNEFTLVYEVCDSDTITSK